jgi:transcriptional regulator with XRE-family HTH domain
MAYLGRADRLYPVGALPPPPSEPVAGLEVASSGVEPLDAVFGGLFWGDNVVWDAAEPGAAEPFYAAVAAAAGYETRIAVCVGEDGAERPGFEVVDARPGREHHDPEPLMRALDLRCQTAERSLLLFDGLDVMVQQWGAVAAEQFFVRCCPRLLELGAVAYWTLPPAGAHPRLRRAVEDVTQCIIAVGDDFVRIDKAQGRPSGVEGHLFRLQIVGDRPQLTAAPMAARVGAAIRGARLRRHLSESDLAQLAGVSPGAISRAETGEEVLSLETLLDLAEKLDLTLDELLRGELSVGYRLGRPPYRARGRIARGEERTPLLDDPETGLRAFLVRLPPSATVAPHLTHEGLEFVAVASGLVQVLLATGSPVLRGGEVLLVEDTSITGWRNLGADAAALFWILRDPRRR